MNVPDSRKPGRAVPVTGCVIAKSPEIVRLPGGTIVGMLRHEEEGYGADRRLLTRREVATYLRVSERTVARLVERGALQSVRLGRLTRFRHADVSALVRGQNEGGARSPRPEDMGGT